MAGFNAPQGSRTSDLVSTAIVNQIHADGVNVKVLPAGSSPTVVYRVGDGTTHVEGWDNVEGNEYLDFYISTGLTGQQGIQGNTGEAGDSITEVIINMLANGEIPTASTLHEVLTMNIPIGNTGLTGAQGEAGLTYKPVFTLDIDGNLYVEYTVLSGMPDETIDGGTWV